jgi:hypothetical protein
MLSRRQINKNCILIGASVVTTGLDPVMHADVQQSKHRMLMRLSDMDCRVKPGNDAEMA